MGNRGGVVGLVALAGRAVADDAHPGVELAAVALDLGRRVVRALEGSPRDTRGERKGGQEGVITAHHGGGGGR